MTTADRRGGQSAVYKVSKEPTVGKSTGRKVGPARAAIHWEFRGQTPGSSSPAFPRAPYVIIFGPGLWRPRMRPSFLSRRFWQASSPRGRPVFSRSRNALISSSVAALMSRRRPLRCEDLRPTARGVGRWQGTRWSVLLSVVLMSRAPTTSSIPLEGPLFDGIRIALESSRNHQADG